MVNGFKLLYIFAKDSIIDVWQALKYASEVYLLISLTLSWQRSISYRNQSIYLQTDQLAGFYMVGTSAMIELIYANEHYVQKLEG